MCPLQHAFCVVYWKRPAATCAGAKAPTTTTDRLPREAGGADSWEGVTHEEVDALGGLRRRNLWFGSRLVGGRHHASSCGIVSHDRLRHPADRNSCAEPVHAGHTM